MGRFSPTVLPQAFDFGGIIERAAQGYDFGSSIKDRRRRRAMEEQAERERQQDRNRYLASLRSQQLAAPGARGTYDEYIAGEIAQGRDPLTDAAKREIGSADIEFPAITFKPPEAQQVTLPSGATTQYQPQTPFTTEMGVVIDPEKARKDQTLAAFLDAQMMRGGAPDVGLPWEREGFADTPEGKASYWNWREKGAGLNRPAPRPEPRQVITFSEALDAVTKLYGTWDKDTGTYSFPFPPEQLVEIARQLIAGEELPSVPTVEPPPATPVSEGEGGPGLGTKIGHFFYDLFGASVGGMPSRGGAAPGGPTNPGGPRAPETPKVPSVPALPGPTAGIDTTDMSGLSEEQQQAVREGRRIPVDRLTYEIILDMQGSEYANKYYVVK